ncbi:MAG TPA: hypothetical protein VLL77_08670 [Anaerolineales bacterium]|nr:hypothetical protein [Anaerolineales bacterium]
MRIFRNIEDASGRALAGTIKVRQARVKRELKRRTKPPDLVDSASLLRGRGPWFIRAPAVARA